ncbi:uncharacterized protein LOC135492948 isoform X2 [Lineus longissimus]|uniref:uncharacterized protein LOC135492948 isoform X2 n=1 Tax=Lineus longissimus TaxID=88925 RepID=UPI00315D7AE6
MAEEAAYCGTWKIVECVPLAGALEPTGIEGTEFFLDESGDVSWKIPKETNPESMPFFFCETYEVVLTEPALLKFYGTYAGHVGHVIEFRVEVSDDLMLLTYERCCMLQCQKVLSHDPNEEAPFSFLGAFEEGHFSDLIIKADNGKEFKVHKTILNLSVPSIDWNKTPPPLTGLKEDVLYAVLYYVYSECLPRGMSETTCKACIKAVNKMPGFLKFSELCETFLKNTALRQQITNLVNDMHNCADKIIDLFSGKVSAGEGQGSSTDGGSDDSLMTNPAKLCYIIKQALREGAVACAKLLILCDLFSRRKGELSREERHEIIKYAKSRIPVFMNQLLRFLDVCKRHASTLTASQRQEMATYLVPEIEAALETISKFIFDTKTALEQVISAANTVEKNNEKHGAEKHEKHKKAHVGEVLGKTLRNALHVRELIKLKHFHEKTTDTVVSLMLKKESFGTMTHEEKVRSVAKNIEQLCDEVPVFLSLRIEELMSALDERVTWKEWKYLFKLGTSKVAWALNKVIANKSSLKSMIQQLNDLVHRDHFSQSLTTLGLLDPVVPKAPDAATNSALPQVSVPTTKYAQLSSVESLCIPPFARDSSLAKSALELLHQGENTDMLFEVVSISEGGDTIIDHSEEEPVPRTDRERDIDIRQIKAHCVVISSRCDWFRRALLSGMRESIDKKIIVHDTNPALFQMFLEYLYSGELETSELATEQLADIMQISDRYEMDSLKLLCEHSLRHHLDEDTALFLLSLADQFHAKILRAASLNFIMDHPSLIESEIFADLPEHLQTEAEDCVAWHGLEPRTRSLSGHCHTETPSSVSSLSEVDELMTTLDIAERDPSSSSSEELPFMEDSVRLEGCLSALRDIVGDTVPREELVRVALAADYDVNRALNFFFSS